MKRQFIILPLLILGGFTAIIAQTTKRSDASPASLQEQIATLNNKVIALQSQVAALRTLALSSASRTTRNDDGSLRDDVDDLQSKVRRFDSDLDDKASRSDLEDLQSKVSSLESDRDDKAKGSDLDDLQTKVEGLFCHFNLHSGYFRDWPSPVDCAQLTYSGNTVK